MVYKGLVCIEAGHVPHIDYVCFKAVSKSNTLKKIDRNSKRLRGSYKKLYDKKMHSIGFKAVQRCYIRD